MIEYDWVCGATCATSLNVTMGRYKTDKLVMRRWRVQKYGQASAGVVCDGSSKMTTNATVIGDPSNNISTKYKIAIALYQSIVFPQIEYPTYHCFISINSNESAIEYTDSLHIYFNHTLPYFTILYHTLPYFTILYHTLPYFNHTYSNHRISPSPTQSPSTLYHTNTIPIPIIFYFIHPHPYNILRPSANNILLAPYHLLNRNQPSQMHNLSVSSHITVASESIYHETGREYNDEPDKHNHDQDVEHQLNHILKKQLSIKNDLGFQNGLAEGRLESIAGILNLFILMLIESLASNTYNNGDTNGVLILGWISIAQVCLFYLLVAIVKFWSVPRVQQQLKDNKSQGFILLVKVHRDRHKLSDLPLHEIELLLDLFERKPNQVRALVTRKEAESLLNQIHSFLNSHSQQEYQYNHRIQSIKQSQNSAKYWQHFWQVFMLGKTYSIPGTTFLLLIIVLASITKLSGTYVLAQGWIAILLWIVSVMVYAVIKLFLWDYLNQKVENANSQPFVLYNSVYAKFKQLKDLSLAELEQLDNVLHNRSDQFDACFPNSPSKEVLESVENLLSQRLPKRRSEVQGERIKELARKEHDLIAYHATWLSFFNTKMISTIINILKFLIVIALSFDKLYPQTAEDVHNAHIVVGSLGTGSLVFGQLFYWYLRYYGLKNMQKEAKEASCKPFYTYRLVYFGNKQLKDLKVHELQEIESAMVRRKADFINCFPKANIQSLTTQIKQILRQKSESQYQNQHLATLLKNELAAQQSGNFWTGYADGPLMTSMYSIYVLLVLLIVSIIAGNTGAAAALGWVGVACFGFLIAVSLFFKCYYLDYLSARAKSLKVQGISEFYLVYSKAKELKNVDRIELQTIQKIIRASPNEFYRCFPNAYIQKILNQIEDINSRWNPQPSQQIHLDIKVDLQVQKLQLTRDKNLLSTWSSYIKQRLYVQLPIIIVVFILWVQSIGTSLYGFAVCGYLTIVFLALALILILFYNLYYREYLEGMIKKTESNIRLLEAELLHH